MFAFILVTSTFLFLIIKFYSGRKSNYWAKKGIFSLQNDLSTLEILTGKKSPPDLDNSYYKQLGIKNKSGGTMELGTPTIFLKDLDLVKNVMVKDFEYFTDHRDFIDTDPLFSKSLFFLHGQEWKDMRAFLSPTFTSGKIRRMFHHFEEGGGELLKYIETHNQFVDGAYIVKVPEIMSRFTVNLIGATAFGMQTDALSNKDSVFYKMAQRSSELTLKKLIKFGVFTNFTKIGNFFNMQSQDKDVSDFFSGILKQAIRRRENSTEQREDFLQLLIEAKQGRLNDDDKDGPIETSKVKVQLTEDLAVSQAFLFFMAGFDSVANLLGEAAYLLALNSEVQERLYVEVEETIEASKGKIQYESTNQMEYMDMFISEILRLYPTLNRLERKCVKDYQIPGTEVIIPKGTIMAIPVESIHMDKENYPDPEKFNPDRFSAENKASRNPYSYLPFGIGPRMCIGIRLGLIETKVALAYLLHNFVIQPQPGRTPIPVKMWRQLGITRVPIDLELRFIPRDR